MRSTGLSLILMLMAMSGFWTISSAQAQVLLSENHQIASKVQAEKSCASTATIHRNQRHFKPTVFHTPVLKAGGNCRLVDENYKTLAKVSCEFKKHCDMQGVCFLKKDNEILGFNFIKRKHRVNIYAQVDASRCPYGYGIWSKEHNRSICMDPYRSVAADNRYHRAGSVLYFPALKGIELPSGHQHDGYMVVRSTGGAIKGRDRFDFYTGFCENPETKSMLCKTKEMNVKLVKSGFGQTQRLAKDKCFYTYYQVPQSLKKIVLKVRNYPDLPYADVLNAQIKLGHFADLWPMKSIKDFFGVHQISMETKEKELVNN